MRISVFDPQQRLADLARSLQAAVPAWTVEAPGELAEVLAGEGPDRVLVFQADPLAEVAGLISRLRAAAPEAAMVLLLVTGEPEWWAIAVRLGVQECVPLAALNGETLADAIRRAVVRRGVVSGFDGDSHGVTEWRRVEQSVRQSEERYRRLLDSVTDYVYTVEVRNGEVISTSHGPGCLAVTGYSVEAFRHDSTLWYQITHPDDRERVVQSFHKLMLDGEPSAIEHRLIRGDGATRWVRNKQVPRRGDEGAIVAYDGLISDITERKEVQEDLVATNSRLSQVLSDLTKSHEELQMAQQQLIQAEKFQAVGQLAAGVAHEVKNPLAILQVGIDYFGDNLPPAPEAKGVLEEMGKAVRDATSVIADLLQASAAREADLRAIAINVMVQQALRLARPNLAKTGVHVVTHLGAEDHLCRVDPGKITHSLVQILLNACDAMPDGGTLTVATLAKTLSGGGSEFNQGDRSGRFLRQGDPVIVVEISDTGVGIPPDKLSRVFDPFFTTKETGKGRGLGLSVAKGIINLHRGEMSIASAEGRGSTVTIVLPNGGREVNIAER